MHQSFQQTRLKGVNKMNKLLPQWPSDVKISDDNPRAGGSFRAGAWAAR
jgi:hypothetical protein